MTLKDIAIFKHFIAERDLRKPFIEAYHRGRVFSKNPDNIEDYFSNVEPLAVILSATKVCVPNAIYGYDFWQDIQHDWKIYYSKHVNNISENNLPTLEGYYMALRENWQNKQKPWRFETPDVAAARLGLDPLKIKEETKEKEETTEETIVEEPQDDDLEIDFEPLGTGRPCRKLAKGLISINIRNSFRLGVNRFDAQIIQDKHLSRAMIGKIKSGDVVIQFNNNDHGAPLCFGKGYSNVNNRHLVERLRDIMSITDDLVYLRIEKIAEKDDSITYKVTKQ